MSVINNYDSNKVVPGTDYNDIIYNSGAIVTITAGGGDDSISNRRAIVSISGGTGNDSIYNDGASVTINGDGGYDSIRNFAANSKISGGAENDTIYNGTGGNNVTISGDDGNDDIDSRGSNVSISGGAGNDSIYVDGANVTVNAGTGKDSIRNFGVNVKISGGTESDTIYNGTGGNNVTISGDDDNDSIDSRGTNVSISGGAGNDKIYVDGANVTVRGGAGDDSIRNYATKVEYQFFSGDGNDTIWNWYDNDTLNLGGAYYTRSTVGSNVVISLTNGSSGSVTLSGASGKTVNIINGTLAPVNTVITNTTSNIVVPGTNGNDTISNSGNNVTINAFGGNDSITNSGSQVTINVNDGNNNIVNFGSQNLLNGGTGNDSLLNGIYVTGSIRSGSNDVTIKGESGADYLYNYKASRVIMEGSAGNDGLHNNLGNNVTMNGGNNDDYINNYLGQNVLILAGSGNDNIYSSGKDVTLNGGKGNDTISFYDSSANNLINYSLGDGNDKIYNFSSTDTLSITSGTYSTQISNSDVIVTVGNDKITLVGAASLSSVNIYPTVNPVITNTASNIVVLGTNGNDTISNSGSNVTVQAFGGNDSITTRTGNNVIISAGTGDDTINIVYANTISVDAGSGKDSIWGNYNYGTINAGENDDTILGNHHRGKISGNGGNDLISITDYWGNSIVGGAGADTIALIGGGEHSINGGAGDDRISLGSATNSTIFYASGDGNDTVWSFNSTNILSINGSYDSVKKTGNDVLVKVGSGSVLFKDYATFGSININGNTIKFGEDKTVTPQDVIKNFMLSLDKATTSNVTTMMDNAIKAVSNDKNITTMAQAVKKMVEDCQTYNGNWDAFLKEKCDINLDSDNLDTGAITGSDAGGSETKTASSVVKETGTIDKNFKENSFSTDRGLTIYLADNKTFNDLSKTEQYIWQGLRSWWLPATLNLIAESYGDNFSFSSLSSSKLSNNLYVRFYNADDGVLAGVTPIGNSTGNWITSEGDIIGDLRLEINMKYYSQIVLDDEDGKSTTKGSGYLDRTLAHEFTHAVMNANIRNATGNNGLPQFIKDGMSELTHGIDDFRTSNIMDYAGDYKALEAALDASKLYRHYPAYAGGYMFLRYIAKQFSTSTSDASYSDKSVANTDSLPDGLSRSGALLTATTAFKGKMINLSDYSSAITKVDATKLTKAIEITGNVSNNSIKSGKGADSVFGGAGNDSLWGGANNDALYGGSGDDLLYGEAGNDSLYAGIGNDILTGDVTGGAGKDVFFYTAGKDIITDYKPGEDKIKILSGEITGSSVSGSDLILKMTDGSITIQNGKGKSITVIDAEDKETTKVYDDTLKGKTLTVTKDVTLGSDYQNADGSALTKTVQITGNGLNNSIKGGSKSDNLQGKDGNDTIYGNGGNDKIYGQADDDKLYGGSGNDSLYGGVGNDSLSGGAGDDYLKGGDGKDVFIYSAGNDVIADFTVGQDKIKLSNASIKSSAVSGDNVVFTLNTGKITVTGGKDQNITIIDASGKETTKKYPATKTLTVTKDATLGSDYQNADASKLTKSVKITGNAFNNSIKGGSGNDSLSGMAGDDKITAGNGKDTLTGGDGNDLLYGQAGDDKIYGQGNNDSLYGGEGNDSLWGGVGNDWLKGGLGNDYLKGGDGDDTFVYIDGDGKDIISGFDNGDLLQITGTFSTSYNSSKREIYFKVGTTDKAITITDFTATTFHVNNDTYQFNGSKLVKK